MILYVDDNSGILLIKQVDVEVIDPISPQLPDEELRIGGGARGKFKEEYDSQEEELLLIIKIFCKVCL